jgi:hypothetical protein
LPQTQFRFRYDSAYGDNRPDRAEFFYGKSGSFQDAPAPLTDPRAPGLENPEFKVNYQTAASYLEIALADRFSIFAEVPVRFLSPDQNPYAAGLSDVSAGFKYAFLYEPDRVATFQFRTYAPTGDVSTGLGTGHTSLEPAVLYFRKLNDRLTLETELRDMIPIDGTDFAGNVLRYGVGVGWRAYQNERIRVTPVVEAVGWTVLSGKESVAPFPDVKDAAGDTIVNLKVGARLGVTSWGDFYAGYGRALTGDVWYKQIFRVEYRLAF